MIRPSRILAMLWPAALSSMAAAQSEPADPARPPRIVNIVNFIRGVEPRCEMDLLEPVVQQIRLAHAHGLPATFLIQYDALIQPRFVELLKTQLHPGDEIGAWLEIVQPQVEAAGLKWRGRFPWDWHTDVGFTVGYTPAERERLIDVYMDRFRATFGRLPRSVGCWLIDAPTLNHLAGRYGIAAACICKDQVGTDGYTLWGGYWNQAYYPSRVNAYMPAQSREHQLGIPVFRMLGSDPIYQYDLELGQAVQGVVSLEPVYAGGTGGGGVPGWVRWFFDVNFTTPCLAFSYAQVGQENSFGWPAMSRGLTDQVELLAEWSRAGRIRVETLEQSGTWFSRTHPLTPATAVTALKDWKQEGRRTAWYNSRFYRANLMWEGRSFRVRDIHLFDERYAERYLTGQVTTHAGTYDTLPVMDGFLWSTRERVAGIRPVAITAGKRAALAVGEPEVTQADPETLLVVAPVQPSGRMEIRCGPASMTFRLSGDAEKSWGLEFSWDRSKAVPRMTPRAGGIAFSHNHFAYDLACPGATITGRPEDASLLVTTGGPAITLVLGR
jgi:hypothetical protein